MSIDLLYISCCVLHRLLLRDNQLANASCLNHFPYYYFLSIDWCYGKQVTVPVEYYESVKPPRREKNQMKIPSEARFEILQNWDYSVYKISRASEEAQRERELRNKSVKAFARRDRLRRGLHGLLSYPLALFEGMRHHEQQKQQHSCTAADADFSEDEDGDKMNNDHLLVHHPEDSCPKEDEQPSDKPSRSLACGSNGEIDLQERHVICHKKNKRKSQKHVQEHEVRHRHIPQGDHRHQQQHNKDDDHKQGQDALSYTHHDHALLLP